MSTGHRILTDLGRAYGSGGNSTIADPGSGGTFDQKGMAYGTATIDTGNRKLPSGGHPMFVVATGDVTISNDTGGLVVTLADGEVALCYPNTSTTWAATILTSGISSEGTIVIPLTSITGETGVVLAAQASTTSGWSQLSNKNLVLNIPVNATNEAFAFSVSAPSDLDTTLPVYVDVFITKAADNDTLTIDAELYAYGYEAGVTADLVTTSAQTIYSDGSSPGITFTCTAPGYATLLGGVLTLGGTNDGDAVYIHGVRIRYSRV